MSESTNGEGGNRWPRLDPSRWPLVLWRQPVLILLVFVVGGAAAFAYSYAPLHRANSWRIAYLEERLAARNEQVGQLESQLGEARVVLEQVPPAEKLEALEARLDEATKLAEARKREVAGLEKKLSRSQRSLSSERKKRERAEAEAVAAAAPPPEPTPAATADLADSTALPAGADPSDRSAEGSSQSADPSQPSGFEPEPFPAAAARDAGSVALPGDAQSGAQNP